MSLGTMALKLLLDTAEFKTGAKDAEGTVSNLGKSMTKLGGVLTSAVKNGFMVATAAVAAFGAATLKTGAEFEKVMKTIQSVTGASASELQALTDEARRLGASTAFSATQAAEGMVELSRAGLSAAETISASQDALLLAGAANASMSQSTSVIAATMAQFGLSANKTNQIVDVFTKTLNSTQFDITQLADAMKFAGVTGAGLGYSLEETTAAVSLFRNLGMQGSMAGNAFKMALAQASVESSKKTAVLERLGLTMNDINPEMNSFSEIMTAVGQAGISTTDAMTVFGARAGAAVKQVADGFADGSTEFFELQNALINSAGTAEQTYTTAMDNVTDKTKVVFSALEELQLTVFDGFGDSIKNLLDVAASVLNDVAMVFVNTTGAIDGSMGNTFDRLAAQLDSNRAEIAGMFVNMVQSTMQFMETLANVIPLLVRIGQLMLLAFKVMVVAKVTASIVTLVSALRNLTITIAAVRTALKLMYAEMVVMSGGTLALVAAVGALVYGLYELVAGSDEATEAANRQLEMQQRLKEEAQARAEAEREGIDASILAVDANNRALIEQLEAEGALTDALERRLDRLRTMDEAAIANGISSGEMLELQIGKGEEAKQVYLDMHTAIMLMNGENETAAQVQTAYTQAVNLHSNAINDQKADLDNLKTVRDSYNRFVAQGHPIHLAEMLLVERSMGIQFSNITQVNDAIASKNALLRESIALQEAQERAATEAIQTVDRQSTKEKKAADTSVKTTKTRRRGGRNYRKELAKAHKARMKMLDDLEMKELKANDDVVAIKLKTMQREIAEAEAVHDKEIALARRRKKSTTEIVKSKEETVFRIKQRYFQETEKLAIKEAIDNTERVETSKTEQIRAAHQERIESLKNLHEIERSLAEGNEELLSVLATRQKSQMDAVNADMDSALSNVAEVRKELTEAALSGQSATTINEYVESLISARDELIGLGDATKELSSINAALANPDIFTSDYRVILSGIGGDIGEIAKKELELEAAITDSARKKLESELHYLKERQRINTRFSQILQTISEDDKDAIVALEEAKAKAIANIGKGMGETASGGIVAALKAGVGKAGAIAKIAGIFVSKLGKGIADGAKVAFGALSTLFNTLTMGILDDLKVDFAGSMKSIAGEVQETYDQIDAAVKSGTLTEDEGAQAKNAAAQSASSNMVSDKINAVQSMIDTISMIGADFISDMGSQVSTLITNLGNSLPEIVSSLTEVIPDVVTSLIDAIPVLLQGIIDAIPVLVTMFVELLTVQLPVLLAELSSKIGELIATIFDAIPEIVGALVAALPDVVSFVAQALAQIIAGIPQLVQTLLEALPTIITELLSGIDVLISALLDALPLLITFILAELPNIVSALVQGILNSILNIAQMLPQLLIDIVTQALPQLIESVLMIITDVITALLESIPLILNTLIMAIPELIGGIIQAVPRILIALITGVVGLIPKVLPALLMLIPELIGGIIAMLPELIVVLVTELITAIPQIVIALVKGLIIELPLAFIAAAAAFVQRVRQFFRDLITEITSLGVKETETFGDTPRPINVGNTGAVFGFEPNDIVVAAKTPSGIMSQMAGAFGGMMNGGGSGTMIPITINANGSVLDKIMVQSMSNGTAPKLTRKFKRASGVKLGYSKGKGKRY